MPDPSVPTRLAVLNPGGRDPEIDYAEGPGIPSRPGHPPVNFHAYAAATRGAFFDQVGSVLDRTDSFDAVLVLIRKRVAKSLDAVRQLKAAGMTVLVAWKEAGPYQVADQLAAPAALAAYRELLGQVDGLLSPTSVLPPHWGSLAEQGRARFLPTPYPVEFSEWNFGQPTAEREGILVGTRQFSVPTRRHLQALSRVSELSHELGVPVTVINGDRKKGRRLLDALGATFPESALTVIDRPLEYPSYLELMARHRLVYQLDGSAVPGQVAGDAALCRLPCVGGNSALEEILFPDLAGDAVDSLDAVDERARRLLTDSEVYESAVRDGEERAAGLASFSVVANQLTQFVTDLRTGD